MRRLAVLGLASVLTIAPLASVKAEGLDIGTLIGAGLGGLVGNQIGQGTGKIAATAVGVFTGGVIGHHVDRGWDSRSGRTYYNAPSTTYYEPRQTVTYVPNYVAPSAPPPSQVVYSQYYGGNDYGYGHRRHHRHNRHYNNVVYVQPVVERQMVVQESYPETNGYCREYTQRVNIGSHIQESYGTACQQQDGSWKIVR